MEKETNKSVANVLDFGDLRVDIEKGAVTHSNGSYALPIKSEALLLLLAKNAGSTVTKEEILNVVWAGRVVEDASISNSVWHIRKALGEKGKHLLRTHSKRGYMLCMPEKTHEESDKNLSFEVGDEKLAYENLAGLVSGEMDHQSEPAELRISSWKDRVKKLQCRAIVLGVLVSIFVILLLLLVIGWRVKTPPRFALSHNVEMSVAISAPSNEAWLRQIVLLNAAEQAYLRESSVIVFQGNQRRGVFSSPHLQVEIRSIKEGRIRADIELQSGDASLRKSYSGPAESFDATLSEFLAHALNSPSRSPDHNSSAMISALMADSTYDHLKALAEYRRASAQSPSSIDAKIGLARTSLILGRSREAMKVANSIRNEKVLRVDQRCDLETILVATMPEEVGEPSCPTSKQYAALQKMNAQEIIRLSRAVASHPKGIMDWMNETSLMASALIDSGRWPDAEAYIRRNALVAEEAGWEYGKAVLESQLGVIAAHRDQLGEAVRVYEESARAMSRAGDEYSAIRYRISAHRLRQIVPGPSVSEFRAELQGAVDKARQIGDQAAEVDALQLLIRSDLDYPERVEREIDRVMTILLQHYSPDRQIPQRFIILSHMRAMQRYRDLLLGLDEMKRIGAEGARSQLWSLTLAANARFALDELPAAAAVIEEMQKENFHIFNTGDACLYSWLFAELRRPDRAWEMLAECRKGDFDRTGQAMRGDYGLYAEARLIWLAGEQDRSWPLLRPRIEALVSTEEPTRQEAESLAFLARHAVELPGADQALLRQALARAETISELDGAGPALRSGVHILRWRLCKHIEGGSDCGPVLPEWARDARLEARLALEAADAKPMEVAAATEKTQSRRH
jgi:DNA-binding winged helix-turn-helix (wHTH) protein